MSALVSAGQRIQVPDITAALCIFWPDELRTNILKACLASDGTSAEGWHNFTAQIGDAKKFFEDDRTGLKGILPLLYSGARRNGLPLQAKMWTYLRSAAFREELRNRVYRQLCKELLNNLDSAGIPVVALKACALAETVYQNPAERHCHAIELMVPANCLSRVSELVRSCRFCESRLPEARPGLRQGFRHESGLPLIIHGDLFDPPIYVSNSAALWAASQPARIADVPVRVLMPSQNLLHVLAAAFYDRARRNLRWVCDAWLLLNASNGVDWQDFLTQVRTRRLELPILVMLGYLIDELDARVPESVRVELLSNAQELERPAIEAALLGGLNGLSELRKLWTRWQCRPGARRDLLRLLTLPSPSYVRWRFGVVSRVKLPIFYAYRPIVYAAERIRWRFLNLPGFDRLTHYRRVATEIEKLRT